MSVQGFDMKGLCERIHRLTKPFNNYPEGIYFNNNKEPTIVPKDNTFISRDGVLVYLPYEEILSCKENIYTEEGILLFDKRQLSNCFPKPKLLVFEIELLLTLINNASQAKAKFITHHNSDVISLIRGTLRDSVSNYDVETVLIENNTAFDALCEAIAEITHDIRHDTLNYCDNPWMIYEVSHFAYILTIGEYKDFRIYDWERRIASGQWG